MNYFSAVTGKLDQFKDSAAPSQGYGYFGQSAFLLQNFRSGFSSGAGRS